MLFTLCDKGEDDATMDQISSIVNQITQDAAHSMTMAQVAAQIGMSESRFSRFFRKATGNTFVDFVNRVRINRACQLLMESDRYITHICYEVGFNNVANFNRRFLEIKGMTPSEFRRQAENRFGGWNAAVLAAGYTPTPSKQRSYERRWTEQSCLEALRDLVADLGELETALAALS